MSHTPVRSSRTTAHHVYKSPSVEDFNEELESAPFSLKSPRCPSSPPVSPRYLGYAPTLPIDQDLFLGRGTISSPYRPTAVQFDASMLASDDEVFPHHDDNRSDCSSQASTHPLLLRRPWESLSKAEKKWEEILCSIDCPPSLKDNPPFINHVRRELQERARADVRISAIRIPGEKSLAAQIEKQRRVAWSQRTLLDYPVLSGEVCFLMYRRAERESLSSFPRPLSSRSSFIDDDMAHSVASSTQSTPFDLFGSFGTFDIIGGVEKTGGLQKTPSLRG